MIRPSSGQPKNSASPLAPRVPPTLYALRFDRFPRSTSGCRLAQAGASAEAHDVRFGHREGEAHSVEGRAPDPHFVDGTGGGHRCADAPGAVLRGTAPGGADDDGVRRRAAAATPPPPAAAAPRGRAT